MLVRFGFLVSSSGIAHKKFWSALNLIDFSYRSFRTIDHAGNDYGSVSLHFSFQHDVCFSQILWYRKWRNLWMQLFSICTYTYYTFKVKISRTTGETYTRWNVHPINNLFFWNVWHPSSIFNIDISTSPFYFWTSKAVRNLF